MSTVHVHCTFNHAHPPRDSLFLTLVVYNKYDGFVAGKIQNEIRQSKGFSNPSEEAVLNILRTSDVMTQLLTDLLKPSGLSSTQYTVLLILRGSSGKGPCCREIGERLVTRDPDVTRLIDRLEKRDLLLRTRDKDDRRVVTIQLTPAGMALVNELDEPIEKWNRKLMRNISGADTKILIDLLERFREGLERFSQA